MSDQWNNQKSVRRHHNNRGDRQIRRGNPAEQMKRLARRLGIPYAKRDTPEIRGLAEEAARLAETPMTDDEIEEWAERLGKEAGELTD